MFVFGMMAQACGTNNGDPLDDINKFAAKFVEKPHGQAPFVRRAPGLQAPFGNDSRNSLSIVRIRTAIETVKATRRV